MRTFLRSELHDHLDVDFSSEVDHDIVVSDFFESVTGREFYVLFLEGDMIVFLQFVEDFFFPDSAEDFLLTASEIERKCLPMECITQSIHLFDRHTCDVTFTFSLRLDLTEAIRIDHACEPFRDEEVPRLRT
jgi:hypothetical protein